MIDDSVRIIDGWFRTIDTVGRPAVVFGGSRRCRGGRRCRGVQAFVLSLKRCE
jgi:hypothetical protein